MTHQGNVPLAIIVLKAPVHQFHVSLALISLAKDNHRAFHALEANTVIHMDYLLHSRNALKDIIAFQEHGIQLLSTSLLKEGGYALLDFIALKELPEKCHVKQEHTNPEVALSIAKFVQKDIIVYPLQNYMIILRLL